MSNAMNWIAYAPIATIAGEYFSVSTFEINLLSSIYMLVYAMGAFSAAYYIESKDMRFGLLTASLLNVIGSLIRILPYPFEQTQDRASGYHAFVFALLGQSLTASAQLFTLAIPPILAQTWFGDHERVRATAIGSLFNQLGICIGFYLSPGIVGEHPERIPYLMLVEAAISITTALPVWLYFEAKPPTPPSLSAVAKSKDKRSSFLQDLRVAFQSESFRILLICFSISYGGFAAICTVLESTLYPYGYDTQQAGMYGSLNVASGMLGAYILGTLADWTKRFKLLAFISFFGSFLSMLIFTLILDDRREFLVATTQVLLGFFMSATVPVCMDLSLETTYPLPETIPTTALMVFSQVSGACMVQVMTGLLDIQPEYSNWFLSVSLGIATFIFLRFRGEEKRRALETPVAEEFATALELSNPLFSISRE